MMESGNDVKLEPDSNGNGVMYANHSIQSNQPYPTHSTDTMIDFVTFRTNVEQTSQLLTDTWMQLHNLLDAYKSQLFTVDQNNFQVPNSDELMKAVLAKERENSNLRDEFRHLCEKYNTDINEKERRIQELLFEVSSEQNDKKAQTLTSCQKIRRLENRIRVLEGKLELSNSLLKSSPSTRSGGRRNNRPSARLLPGKRLVERVPTPPQIARVTPVATADPKQTSDPNTQFNALPKQSSTKVDCEADIREACTKQTGSEHAQYHGQKLLMNSGETAAVQQRTSLPPWTSFATSTEQTANPVSSSQSLFLCPHCTQSFNNEQALDHHLRASHRKFICPKCYEHYTKKYDLLNHIGLVHGKRSRDGPT